METEERVKKQEPGRTQPIRNWGVLFEPSGNTAAQVPPRDPVSRGVEMGYQVVEEYFRQGQSVARGMWTSGPGSPPSSGDGVQNQLGALLRTFADFASQWMGLMGQGPGRGPAREPGVTPPVGTAGPFSAGTAPGVGEAPPVASSESAMAPPRLTLDLDSPRHLEVSVDLRPRPLDRTFRVLGLDGSDSALPRIQGVTVEVIPDEERIVIRLRIPESQPPGTYGGIILDERTGLPRGTLCVRVLA